MSFPLFPDKHGRESVFRAEDVVAFREQLGRTPKLRSCDGVLFCLERGLPERLKRRIPVDRVGGMNADVYQVKKRSVAVLTGFSGSPMIVKLAEEMAVMGARRMVLMTMAGALQSGLKAGDIVVCDRALRDDGASRHYLPPERYVDADAGLVERLYAALRDRGAGPAVGATWTTDAPYRETRAEVERYQAEGIKTVEMESAGLFAAASVRGVAAASVIVVMDSLASLRWEVPQRLDAVERSLELVYAAAIDVLDSAG